MTKVFSNRENTNAMEIRELLDQVGKEMADFKADVRGTKNVVQSLEYTVTGMSKKLYFPRQ